MAGPGNSQDGVLFTQTVTAVGGGRVNAVQHGDQYNYIYRGTPPYRVEPFPLAEPAVPTGLARVPSRLLTARHRVVPFFPRPELALLESWRDDDSPGLSVRLVHAEGGSGKTRLAAEFAERSARAGWAVALARHRSEVASAGGGDVSLAVRAPGLVIVVDYAERWPLEDLITLVRQRRDAARDRLRILLLARPAGTWWQGLAHQFAKLDILEADALGLAPLPDDPGLRANVYTAARDRFAAVFALADPGGIIAPEGLGDPVFALTLTVHMRALIDVDAASRGLVPPTGSGQAALSSYLLDREHDHWRSSHDQGHGPARATEQVMGRTVYLATLTRPLAPDAAAVVLAGTGVAETAEAAGLIVDDHARCYPAENSGLVLEPLYPDRLGEDYLALTLPGREDEFGYHATDPWASTAPELLLTHAAVQIEGFSWPRPPAYTRQVLSVLIESAHRWPHVTTTHLEPILQRYPTLALAAGSAVLSRLADLADIDPAVLAGIASRLPNGRHVDLDLGAAALTRRLADLKLATTTDPEARASLYHDLGWRLGNAGLHQDAVAPAQEAVAIRRRLAATDPAAHEPGFAASLTNLGSDLSQTGHRVEALEATTEAVQVYRRLLAAAPAAHTHLSAFAGALTNLGVWLSDLGRSQDALAPAREAVAIQRRLVAADPAAHEPGLAMTLNNLSSRLSELGRRGDALVPAREALDIFRRSAAANPAAYEHDLALTLNNLAKFFKEVGHRAEALDASTEALGVHRRLAGINPAGYEQYLAMDLTNLAVMFTEVGRWSQGVQAAEEAVEVYRRLTAAMPAAHEPALGAALSNLSFFLAGVGRWSQGVQAAEEAAEVYRRLTAAMPAAHEPALGAALSNLGLLLLRVGRRPEAVAAASEAVEVRRRLAGENPAAHEPDLVIALNGLGMFLGAAARPGEALEVSLEAVQVCRRLVEASPAAYESVLAAALSNIGNHLAALGRSTEAVAAASEAVEVRRRLAGENPAAHEPDLATALSNLSLRLIAVGQPEQALEAATEAIDVRCRLTEANPAAHEPELVNAMNNLGLCMAGVGKLEEASIAIMGAVGLAHRLAAADPQAHEPAFALSLGNLAIRLAALGRLDEALKAALESVVIYKRLAAREPAAFLGPLRVAVKTLMTLDGRTEEAETIRRRLRGEAE